MVSSDWQSGSHVDISRLANTVDSASEHHNVLSPLPPLRVQHRVSIRLNLSTPVVTGVRKLVVFRETLAETVRHDFFEERPQWPFSSYAPFPKMRSECGSDTSFEELRYYEMKLIKIDRKPIEEVSKQTSEILEHVKQRTQSYYNQVGSAMLWKV